jgi:hypothetical protein
MTQPVNAWVVLTDASAILEASYPMGRLGTLEDAQVTIWKKGREV